MHVRTIVMGSTEEPDRKRRHLNNNHSESPPAKKQHHTPSSEDKKVDAQMLQFQNHKLAQQLVVTRNEIEVLEDKLNVLRSKQASFDENLSTVSRVWNQVVDDLESLTVRATGTTNGNHAAASASKERSNSSVPAEQTFLQRLLDRGATESSTPNGNNGSIESGHSSRKASTAKTLKYTVQSIDSERTRHEGLVSTFRSGLSSNGLIRSLAKTDEELFAEAKKIRGVLDCLLLKHRELSAELGTCHDLQAKDQAEIRRITGELEEACADKESIRRQLAALRSQDASLSGPPTPSATPTRKVYDNGSGCATPENFSKENSQLEAGLEEAKALAAGRLTELKEALHNQLDIMKKIQLMQDELDNHEHIMSSRQYQSLTEQIQSLRSEVERLRGLVDQSQGERVSVLRREKEVVLKAEAGDAARRAAALSDARAADLELKLQQCMSECDTLQLKVEDATQASGRKESVADLKIVITTLHKDMNMMQAQLHEFKEAGSAVHSLRAELHSMRAILERKTDESQVLSEQYASQVVELNLIQDEVSLLRASGDEMKLFMDMYDRESNVPRELREFQQAECRSRAEVERLQSALDEHNLELRVKAAIEAEAACQQKLTAVEADIAELRQSLEASVRVALDLREALQAKKEEGDAYVSEIQNIGQSYEDMHVQNQRLLSQIIERDDYNAQLMSESLKSKQLQTSLKAEKQVLNTHMQHANATADLQKQHCIRLEDHTRAYNDQLTKATDDSQHQVSAMEKAKQKATHMEKELTSAKASLATADKVLKERDQKLLNVSLQLENERYEKRRAQEELEVVSAKTARLNTVHDGGPKVEQLQEQIKDLKDIVRCSVCHDRRKEVIITKCFHLFCNTCIQRNLEHRHRKCPGCGTPFTQSDVRIVYI